MKYLTDYIGGSVEGYVAVDVDGVLKAQKLEFNGSGATPTDTLENLEPMGIFSSGTGEPEYLKQPEEDA